MIQKIIKLTPEQAEALSALLALTGDEFSSLIRTLIGIECARHGIIFQQNMPTKADNVRKRYTQEKQS